MWTNWWWQFFKFNVNVHLQTNLAHINMNPNKKFKKKNAKGNKKLLLWNTIINYRNCIKHTTKYMQNGKKFVKMTHKTTSTQNYYKII